MSPFSHVHTLFLRWWNANPSTFPQGNINMINDKGQNNYSVQETSLDFIVDDFLSLHILIKMFLHLLSCWWRFPCCPALGNCRSIVSMLPTSCKVFSYCIWRKLGWSWTWINLNAFQVLFCLMCEVLVSDRYSTSLDLSVETTCDLVIPPARAKWMLLSLYSLNKALPLIMVGYFWCL